MNADFLDLLTALSAADARFLVVGGYAVGIHGIPRATKDLDVWIEVSADNARKSCERCGISVRLWGTSPNGISKRPGPVSRWASRLPVSISSRKSKRSDLIPTRRPLAQRFFE
jgi:hypothetical protein